MKQSQGLQEILREMIVAQDQLLALQKKKQQVLVEAEADPLFVILAEETKLVKHVEELEKKRQQEVQLLTHSSRASMSQLIPLLSDTQEQEELKKMQQILQSKIEELQNIHHVNKQLIEQSLAYTTYSLQLLIQRNETPMTYSNRATNAYSERFFDTKA